MGREHILAGIAEEWMRQPQVERRRAGLAILLEGGAMWVQLWLAIGVFPVSDALRYHRAGAALAAQIRELPESGLQALLGLVLRQPGAWDHGLRGGGSTDTMVAVSSCVNLAVGDNLVAATVLVVGLGLAARWWLYRSLASVDPSGRASFVAVLALPSLLFWAGGLSKESLAAGGLALLIAGLLRRDGPGVAGGLVGLVLLGLIRPWLLGSLAVASLALLGRTPWARFTLLGAGSLGALGVAEWGAGLLGLSPLSDRLAWQQAAALQDQARSHAPVVVQVPEGLLGQVALAPRALLRAVCSPLPWEARGVLAAFAVVENLVLVGVSAVALRPRRRAAMGGPEVAFALGFAALALTGIGLTTANLGTLSRHRALVVPFLWWVALWLADDGSRPTREM